MISIKKCLLTGILFSVSLAGFAQQKEIPVNLPAILKLTGANNLTIRQYELQYQLSLAEVDKAREWYLPVISLGPSFHYLSGATIQTTGALLPDVTQKELWLGGGLVAQIDFNNGIYNVLARKKESEAVKAGNEAQRNQIIIQAIGDYYNLVTAQFSYHQMVSLLSQADTLTKQIRVQVEAGLRYQSEYLLAKSNYNHIQIELTNDRIEMQKQSNALLSILNVDTNATLISSDTALAPIEIVKSLSDSSMTSYIQNRPEYKSMLSEMSSLEYQKKTTTVGLLLPKLVVGTPDALFGTFGPPYYNTYHLDGGLFWNIPLGRIIYKGDLKIYNDNILIAQNQVQQFGNTVRQQVRDSRMQTILAMQQLKVAKEALDESKSALGQSVEREKLGTVRPFEVLQTEQFYVQAEVDYLKSVSNYNQAEYQLYVAMGNNL